MSKNEQPGSFLERVEAHQDENTVAFQRLITDDSFKDWLLPAFTSGHPFAFAPLEISYKDDAVEYIRSCIEFLPEDMLEKAKVGIVHAMSKWDPKESNMWALTDLGFLALYANAQGVIPVIGAKIIDGPDTDLERTACLIGILGGFADNDREAPRETLLTLYDQDRFHPELTPNLFLSIAASLPEEYPSYLERVMSYEEYYEESRYKGFTKYVAETFIEDQGWEVFLKHLHELPDDTAPRVISLVGRETIQTQIDLLQNANPDINFLQAQKFLLENE